VGLLPLAFWGCGFESRRGHGCLSVVSVVCCEVAVSVTGRSLVQRSPTECGVSECNRESSITRRLRPTRAVVPWQINNNNNNSVLLYYTAAVCIIF